MEAAVTLLYPATKVAWHSQAVLAFTWMWVKTFCRHLYGVFNSALRLGNCYFCPNIKFSWPLGSVTAEAGAGGKSWHIPDWGLRILQACCHFWTSPVLGCCSLNKLIPPVPLAHCELSKSRLPWLILEVPMAPSRASSDQCGICCTKKEGKPPMQPFLN